MLPPILRSQTKLLYRSWLTDGTIPPDYLPAPPSSTPDLFSPRPPTRSPSASTQTSTAAPTPADPALPPTPTPMPFAASLYASAVPPAHISDPVRATPSPVPADLPSAGGEGLMLPPEGRAGPAAGARIDLGGEGKIRVGAVAGSSWRTEKDVASGSDLY